MRPDITGETDETAAHPLPPQSRDWVQTSAGAAAHRAGAPSDRLCACVHIV